MVRRNVKWLSFFIFISILSLFRGWSFIKQFHLSAFTVLAVFIYALYSYISCLLYTSDAADDGEQACGSVWVRYS